MLRKLHTLLAIIILIGGCSPRESVTKKIDQLDSYFREQFPAGHPGGAVLIMHDDSVIFTKGYGLADVNTKEAITPKTLFNVGSISKTFVANGILLLQEQGRLSVDDNLNQYFPHFRNKSIAEKVKIKHLLTHTSGLPDNRQVSKDTVFYLTAKDAENWYPITQADSLLFEPGSQFQYSNPAFNGLALIIEQVSGMKWQTFVRQNIMLSAGMTTSTITDGPHPETGVAHGYVKSQGGWIEDDYGEEPTFPASGNGGVWSSVEELAKYELGLRSAKFLTQPTVVDSRTIKQFDNWRGTRRPNVGWSFFQGSADGPNASIEPFIGWSWFITQTPDSINIIGHTGTQGGFVANYVSIPDKKIFFIVLCNSPHDIDELSNRIMLALKDEQYLN